MSLRRIRETTEAHATPNASVAGSSRVGGPRAFGGTLTELNETIVFCATYKLVSCKWDPSPLAAGAEGASATPGATAPPGTWETQWGPEPTNELGGRYICNQRKHTVFVGFQLHGDEENGYDTQKTFYARDDERVKSIIGGWKTDTAFFTQFAQINRTDFPTVPPHLVFGKPEEDVQVSNLIDFLEAHDPSSLCMKHALLA